MRLACVTVAYKEERFIKPFIQKMQNRVEEIVVLNSATPWNGDVEPDNTAAIAESLGATVFKEHWPSEHEQRNAGQEYCADYDWIIVLDPDEYILDFQWNKLLSILGQTDQDALVVGGMNTYWRRGYIIDPPEPHTPIIAVRPHVRFFETRCVASHWSPADIIVEHFSWARSDEEVWRKITHYGEAGKFDAYDWFSNVWSDRERLENLHPINPPDLKRAVPVELPEELEELNLWP